MAISIAVNRIGKKLTLINGKAVIAPVFVFVKNREFLGGYKTHEDIR